MEQAQLLTQGTREWQIPEDEEGNSLLDNLEDLDDQVVPDRAADSVTWCLRTGSRA